MSVGSASVGVVVDPVVELDGAAFVAYDFAAVPDDYRLDRPIKSNNRNKTLVNEIRMSHWK